VASPPFGGVGRVRLDRAVQRVDNDCDPEEPCPSLRIDESEDSSKQLQATFDSREVPGFGLEPPHEDRKLNLTACTS